MYISPVFSCRVTYMITTVPTNEINHVAPNFKLFILYSVRLLITSKKQNFILLVRYGESFEAYRKLKILMNDMEV